MAEEQKVIYLNTVSPLNQAYMELLEHLKENDFRASYLTDFEQILSFSMMKHSLFEDEFYKKFVLENGQLPDDRYKQMTSKEFRARMTAFEMVMRDHGLIGKVSTPQIVGLDNYRKGGDEDGS